MNEQIILLDFGSQYTQVIARRIRECNVYSQILRYDTPATEIARLKPSGIILSGGPSSVYAKGAPLPDKSIFDLGVPVLGVCFGVQLFAHFLGGKVEKGLKREYGKGTLTIKDSTCALFAKLPASLQVWNSHGDKLTKLPNGFKPVAVTENSEYAAIENRSRKFFGLQFHPEVVHTPRGSEIISNFVHQICGCGKNWTMHNYVDQAVAEIRAQFSMAAYSEFSVTATDLKSRGSFVSLSPCEFQTCNLFGRLRNSVHDASFTVSTPLPYSRLRPCSTLPPRNCANNCTP